MTATGNLAKLLVQGMSCTSWAKTFVHLCQILSYFQNFFTSTFYGKFVLMW